MVIELSVYRCKARSNRIQIGRRTKISKEVQGKSIQRIVDTFRRNSDRFPIVCDERMSEIKYFGAILLPKLISTLFLKATQEILLRGKVEAI